MATQLKLRPGISLDGLSSSARSMVDRILSTTDLGDLDVTSAHRNPFLNAKVGGAKGSQHIQGNAIDINVSGLNDDQKQQLLKSAIAAGAKGVGIYPSGNAIHLDTRANPTLWGPGKNKYSGVPVEKAPAWAQPVLKQMFAGQTPDVTQSAAKAPSAGAPPVIKSVIAEASAKFGVSEDLMTRIAARESSFNPGATNPKSSAGGLYQFIDKTWSGMVAKYGAAAGVAPDASRFDPKAAALMAAAMTKENDLIVKKVFGRSATPGELYVGHFMGGPKMVSMMQLNEKQPDAPAAVAFPAEAAANPTIFFNKAGEPQPVSAVYANLTNINTATGGSSVAAAPAGPKADFNFTPVKGATPAVQHASQGSVELESEVDRFGKRMGGRRMLG